MYQPAKDSDEDSADQIEDKACLYHVFYFDKTAGKYNSIGWSAHGQHAGTTGAEGHRDAQQQGVDAHGQSYRGNDRGHHNYLRYIAHYFAEEDRQSRNDEYHHKNIL